jgi:hypothetical protein
MWLGVDAADAWLLKHGYWGEVLAAGASGQRS